MVDARKALNMFRETRIHPLGIVENMAGPIFGEGTAEAWASREHIPYLGSIPLDSAIRVGGDEGLPASAGNEASVRAPFEEVADALLVSVAHRVASRPDRPGVSLG